MQEYFDDPFGAEFTARIAKKEEYEILTIDKTDHLYQNDMTVVQPFELEFLISIAYYIKGTTNFKNDFMIPSSQKACFYQFFLALWLKFLHGQGLQAPGLQMDQIEATINKFKGAKKGDTGFIYTDPDEFDKSQYLKKKKI